MRYLLPLLLVFAACSTDTAMSVDAALDTSVEDGAMADASAADAGAADAGAADAGATDAGRLDGSTLGGRWLSAVAHESAEFCRCEISVRDYATVEECALAEGYGAGVRACANEAMRAFLPELGEGFGCVAAATEQKAACFAAQASCGADGLNACESTAGPVLAACAPTPTDALDGFFSALGGCVRGASMTCPDAVATSATGRIASGNTVGAGNDFSASCAAGGDVAPDRAISWTAPAAGRYRFDTFGSSFDTQLVAYASCDGGAELGCNDDAGDRRTSQLELELSAGDSIVLVVDGFDELSAGDYVLNVTAL